MTPRAKLPCGGARKRSDKRKQLNDKVASGTPKPCGRERPFAIT